jgi:hypothetical protein
MPKGTAHRYGVAVSAISGKPRQPLSLLLISQRKTTEIFHGPDQDAPRCQRNIRELAASSATVVILYVATNAG